MNNAAAKPNSRVMREIMNEPNVSQPLLFHLFLNLQLQSIINQNYDVQQLSLFGEGRGSGIF